MINKFKVGTNFDLSLIEEVKKLNEEFEGNSVVTEFYGSTREHAKYAARPDFRLPDVSPMYLEKYVSESRKAGIAFNYTLNSIQPVGAKYEFAKQINSITGLLGYLETIGVERITVANPMMLEVLREHIHSKLKVEVSTIMHIDTITQIKYLHDMYPNIDKVCGNQLKNRDFTFLKAAAEYCNANDIKYELMVNEFCGVGGDNYATHCIYRDSCYICHATDRTMEDAKSFNDYPMSICTASRDKNPSNWLKVRFIRPEDLREYRRIGINNFKITGRTGSTEYLLRTLRSYMGESFDGNLLNLWKPLESIKLDQPEAFTSSAINNKDLNGFIYQWTEAKCKCENHVCGTTCTYCDDFYDKLMKDKGGHYDRLA